MKKVKFLIKIPKEGKDERITVRLTKELNELLSKEPNVSEVMRVALEEYFVKHGETLTAESCWKNQDEIEVYKECCGFFNKFEGITKENLSEFFPDPPPERLLPYILNQLTYDQSDTARHDLRLTQMFMEDHQAWLEFYAKARAFYFHEDKVPYNLLSEKQKEEYKKYIMNH